MLNVSLGRSKSRMDFISIMRVEKYVNKLYFNLIQNINLYLIQKNYFERLILILRKYLIYKVFDIIIEKVM